VKQKQFGQIGQSFIVKRLFQSWQLYVLIAPTLVYVAIFAYRPMVGVIMAFQDYNFGNSILGSPFVGLKHFTRLVNLPAFPEIVRNTIVISLYTLLAGFPIPITLALMMNTLVSVRYKKVVQTVTYAPHFISTVVIVGMLSVMLSPTTGVVNGIIKYFGGEAVFFLGKPSLFSSLYVWSGVWQNMGFSSIIYMAALSGIDPGLHEAAIVDGAGKFKRIFHVDLPGILPTIVILLIMSTGNIMNVGFEKAYLMQNALNISASEVISTYVYKTGLLQNQLSFSTAVNLFNSLINLTLLVTVNSIARRASNTSLW
jgi:putative aldouronate transport system permease protein